MWPLEPEFALEKWTWFCSLLLSHSLNGWARLELKTSRICFAQSFWWRASVCNSQTLFTSRTSQTISQTIPFIRWVQFVLQPHLQKTWIKREVEAEALLAMHIFLGGFHMGFSFIMLWFQSVMNKYSYYSIDLYFSEILSRHF